MYHSSKADCWTLIADYVSEWVPTSKIEAFVDAVQPNLVMPKDALPWAEVIFGDTLSFQPEVMQIMKEAGAEFFNTALAILEDPKITFKDLVNELQIKTNRKGKLIFFPLRAALTAELHGPELAKVLDLLGIDKARLRLAKAAEYAANL
jgi:glutamyl-tRNA synthetase